MNDLNLLVGTYTRDTNSSGIYHATLDGVASCVVQADNPSYLALDPNGTVVYCVNETQDYANGAQDRTGGLSAYSLTRHPDQDSISLELTSEQRSMGADPCHITVTQNGRFIVVSNYTGGTLVTFPIDNRGQIGSYSCLIRHSGSGPNKDRQESAHVHSSLIAGDHVYVADLGADKVIRYALSELGSIDKVNHQIITSKPGAGPRFMAKTNTNLLVLNELDNTLSRYSLANLAHEITVNVAPEMTNSQVESIAAHIELSNDQQFIYVSNRGYDTISVFRNSDQLEYVQSVSTGGCHPRHFTLVGDNQMLLVANKDSDNIIGFVRDSKTGMLSKTDFRIAVPSPVCLLPI